MKEIGEVIKDSYTYDQRLIDIIHYLKLVSLEK